MGPFTTSSQWTLTRARRCRSDPLRSHSWRGGRGGRTPAPPRQNAATRSIVVRIDYKGRSVLFTGDRVGKRLTDDDGACKDAEKVMVDRHTGGEVSIKADVLVASHHGGNNGSAACFIQAIDPQFVIFASRSAHQHPRRPQRIGSSPTAST